MWYYPIHVIDTPCYVQIYMSPCYTVLVTIHLDFLCGIYIGIAMFTILYSFHLHTVHVRSPNYALVLIS